MIKDCRANCKSFTLSCILCGKDTQPTKYLVTFLWGMVLEEHMAAVTEPVKHLNIAIGSVPTDHKKVLAHLHQWMKH